jgi:hypothetical protein
MENINMSTQGFLPNGNFDYVYEGPCLIETINMFIQNLLPDGDYDYAYEGFCLMKAMPMSMKVSV